jgi:hypothetical protein
MNLFLVAVHDHDKEKIVSYETKIPLFCVYCGEMLFFEPISLRNDKEYSSIGKEHYMRNHPEIVAYMTITGGDFLGCCIEGGKVEDLYYHGAKDEDKIVVITKKEAYSFVVNGDDSEYREHTVGILPSTQSSPSII